MEDALKIQEEDIASLGEQIDQLGQEILATAFAYTDRLRKGGRISADEEYKQKQMQVQFNYIEKAYNKLIRTGRVTGVPGSISDANFIDAIKKKKSTMGDIVRDMNEEVK